MEPTDHLKASLTAAIALANVFGAPTRQGRPAIAPDDEAIRAVLRLTTNRTIPIELHEYETGARQLYDALSLLPDVDAAVELINDLLRRTQAAPQLMREPGALWHLHFAAPGVSAATGWLAEFATAVAMLLGSHEAERLRRCAAERCDELFLDSTKNHTQRFCSTACQNRTKVAAHRARSA
ncbi:CGNR zinc finger domain-containing protein [Kribbella antibiotica]|uniref:CGNR zinc finger domain-containing protein n=1 Tax=Kribbella antibiotica TaxID=190195 RepID=A0A4R4ZRY1_9ACTN|nr:CGNR zinc finger domain-containing protein [Kribbella antibiotica]TDD61753.1 CGNR zinc finger domain-containing protein [Kribbella antibiotica]